MRAVREQSGSSRRWTFAVWFIVMFFIFSGFSRHSIASALVLIIAAVALWAIEVCTRRPRRSFYRLALASSLLLIFLIDASWQGRWMLALVTWAGISVLALVWTAHYERTEPLT
jgi:formate/nitrite transporter FocA (FNT family)